MSQYFKKVTKYLKKLKKKVNMDRGIKANVSA